MIGFANITSILAYNSTARELNVSPYSASLQLNVPLLLFNGRENQTYWAQNVVTFITNESALCFESSILNVTNKNSTLTNFTVQGRGGVYPPFNNGFYYIYKTRSFHYSTPLSFLLSINVSIVKKLGVKLTFNVRGMQNGSLLNSSWDTYDSVLILDPAVTQAYLYVNGNSSPPYLNFYDAELVFGGGGNGATAYFENLSAYLSLFYFNGSLHPFPSVYSIGGDTAETASNAHVTLVGGYAYVSKGEDDPELLTNEYNSSIPIIVKIVPSHQSNTTKLQNTTTTNVTNTTKVTNTTRTSPVSTQNQTPTTQIPPTPSHQSSFSLPLVLGIAGVVIVVIIVFLVNRFRKPDLNI
ncbi:thermopsin family protease [Metallosphaera hakonensis]|uniref:thermopsin family protease n=1 Tax=Metallosphaera hakonensis TaxID=79601 RepID=UPI0006D0D7B4|nr:thermopsin family protease [Metallosphaera hakonensis]